MEFNWTEAEASLAGALALEPMNGRVLNHLSFVLQAAGRNEEAVELIERAVTADPLNLFIRAEFCWRLLHAQRFRRVIEEANRILARSPTFARAYELLGNSYQFLGDLDAAHNANHRGFELAGRPAWFLEAHDRGYETGGFKGAKRELLTAIRHHDDGSISHAVRAIWSCDADEPEEALVELNHALRRRNPIIVLIGTSPEFDCVRSDPRFQDLLREINWPGLER
jgi:tetratricopeptide (TPR) repeat protein